MPDSLGTICFPRSFLCFDLLLVLKLDKKARLCKFHWPLDLCTFCVRGREVGLSVVASSPFRSPESTAFRMAKLTKRRERGHCGAIFRHDELKVRQMPLLLLLSLHGDGVCLVCQKMSVGRSAYPVAAVSGKSCFSMKYTQSKSDKSGKSCNFLKVWFPASCAAP